MPCLSRWIFLKLENYSINCLIRTRFCTGNSDLSDIIIKLNLYSLVTSDQFNCLIRSRIFNEILVLSKYQMELQYLFFIVLNLQGEVEYFETIVSKAYHFWYLLFTGLQIEQIVIQCERLYQRSILAIQTTVVHSFWSCTQLEWHTFCKNFHEYLICNTILIHS